MVLFNNIIIVFFVLKSHLTILCLLRLEKLIPQYKLLIYSLDQSTCIEIMIVSNIHVGVIAGGIIRHNIHFVMLTMTEIHNLLHIHVSIVNSPTT